ncbi:MAG: hypothetical protein IT306_29465 [Chloroflexi bacterium]|nr:hypothetical protein [Chloroflexota bacterium]
MAATTTEHVYLTESADGHLYVSECVDPPAANSEDYGDADVYENFEAASAKKIRVNCHLDAPAGYKHWACVSKSPTPCPVTIEPHFGCDHQDGICQETRR